MTDVRQTLGIGELAKIVGISTHALRVWERRYGSPRALRRPSGHRRYPYSEVERLKYVAEALRLGFRAGVAVPASQEELILLIEQVKKERERKDAQKQAQEGKLATARRVIAAGNSGLNGDDVPVLWPGVSSAS